MDYEAALSFTVENSPAQHDVVAGATGGPVAPRLDRLIRREIVRTWAVCETREATFRKCFVAYSYDAVANIVVRAGRTRGLTWCGNTKNKIYTKR